MVRHQPEFTIMKTQIPALLLLLFLTSCVFEEPFEPDAKIPVNTALLGRWESVPSDSKKASESMLVLQHSANEYAVQYPVGEKAMFFRAIGVELSGQQYIQVQWIGTAEGPVKPDERKYHLVKIELSGDQLSMSTLDPNVLGKDKTTTKALREAFAKKKDNPKLFDETTKFRRVE